MFKLGVQTSNLLDLVLFFFLWFPEELKEAERRREEGDSSAPTVRAQIPFSACMAALSEPEMLTDFWSSAVQAKTSATKYGTKQPAHNSTLMT